MEEGLEIFPLDDATMDKNEIIRKVGTAATSQKEGIILLVDAVVPDQPIDAQILLAGKVVLIKDGAEQAIAFMVTEAQAKTLATNIATRLSGLIAWKLVQKDSGGNGNG